MALAECPKCGTEFDAEGKIARCPDCRATFKNEGPSKKKAPKKEKPKEKEPPKPAAAPQPVGDDMYGFDEDVNLGELRRQREEDEEKRKQEKKKDAKPIIQIKRKNIGDLEVWARIDKSMIWFMSGACVWALYHFFYGLILFLGMVQGPEYAGPVVRFLIRPDQPPFELGAGDALDRVSFVLAMLGGSNLVTYTFGILLVMQILSWVQTGLWVTGYAMAWQGTELMENDGARGQLITLFVTSGLNFLFGFFLIFLPLVGAYGYVLMPLWGAEMSLAQFNMERSAPLHIFWSYAPFWEELLTYILLFGRYFEPLMIAYFIWTVSTTIKEDVLQKKALGNLKMGFAILFLLFAFELIAITGTSPVLVKVLRILYVMWYAFMVAWIVGTAALAAKCRETFRFYFFPDAD